RLETLRLKEKCQTLLMEFNEEGLNKLIAGSWSAYYSNTEGMLPVDENGLNVYFKSSDDTETYELRFDVLIRKHDLPCVSASSEEPEGAAAIKFLLNTKGAGLYTLFRDISFT